MATVEVAWYSPRDKVSSSAGISRELSVLAFLTRLIKSDAIHMLMHCLPELAGKSRFKLTRSSITVNMSGVNEKHMFQFQYSSYQDWIVSTLTPEGYL